MKGMLTKAAGTQDKLEMIYLAKDNQITLRIIKELAVADDKIKAYCYTKRHFRTFKLDNILSVGPLRKRMGA